MVLANTFKKLTRSCAALALPLIGLAGPAQADEWEFQLAPLFLWGISIDGDATIGTNTLPLDLNFKDDIFDNMDSAATIHFEAKNDEILFFAEYQRVKLNPTTGAGPIVADVDFENINAEIGAGWEFYDKRNTSWQFLFGIRYFKQDVDVDGSLSLPPGGTVPIAVTGGDDWGHGFLGIRGLYSISDRWTLVGRGDAGFGGDDNTALNLSFLADYRFLDWGSVFFGYRHMDVDYKSSGSLQDRYAFNAAQRGPLLGVNFRW